MDVDVNTLFETLYRSSLSGDADGDGMLAYNYLAGEHVVNLEAARPMYLRGPNSKYTMPKFMRTHLFAALGALRIGLDILFEEEGIGLDSMFAHGGLFKTEGVMQRYLAAAANVPVSVGDVAGEGGSWGMALLAAFMKYRDSDLSDWLEANVFSDAKVETMAPDPADVAVFEKFMKLYREGLAIEKAATESLQL